MSENLSEKRSEKCKDLKIDNNNIQKFDIKQFHSQKIDPPNNLIEENDNPYNESENSREDYLPLNEKQKRQRSNIIKGLFLAFIFFSVIIYSLLCVLAPEKNANIYFKGNNLINSNDNYIYELDNMIINKNKTFYLIKISLYYKNDIVTLDDKIKNINNNITQFGIFLYINNILQKLDIFIYNTNQNLIFKHNIFNYTDFILNDLPFWICFKNSLNQIYNLTAYSIIQNS